VIFRAQAIGRRGAPPDERRFERTVLPHLDAAHNLARWMTGNDQDAEDVVQEASVRAFRFLDGYRGGDGRAWFLTIVRNTCQSWLRRNRAHEITGCLDDEREAAGRAATASGDPEAILLGRVDTATLYAALEALPLEFREVLVLREMEELSYKEIADIVGVPIGTVMSRLARARKRLQQRLTAAEPGVRS
jgi:RNA polymerase sigma-70 factor (ECF subfamily)